MPISFVLPHYDVGPATAQQNPDCFLSWLHNGGTSSPRTSGQQKLYTSSVTDWIFCSDCTVAHEENVKHLKHIKNKNKSFSLLFLQGSIWSSSAYLFNLLAQIWGCIHMAKCIYCYKLNKCNAMLSLSSSPFLFLHLSGFLFIHTQWPARHKHLQMHLQTLVHIIISQIRQLCQYITAQFIYGLLWQCLSRFAVLQILTAAVQLMWLMCEVVWSGCFFLLKQIQ